MSESPNPAAEDLHDPQQGVASVERPQPLCIHLLGGFRVAIANRVIEDAAWRLRKAKSLVKLLALAPGHTLHREQLMDRLWPDADTDAAANNLRYVLHVARRVLHSVPTVPPQLLQLQGGRLALCPSDPVWIDVDAFERVAAIARRSSEPTSYYAAIDLYTGDLLPEDRYEDWTAGRREALRATHLGLLIDVAQLHEVEQEYPQAIKALERVVAVEPAHEQAHAGLMRLYALSGQRSRALQQYQHLQHALGQELDAEPDPASQLLYAEIHAGRFPPVAPPVSSTARMATIVPRHNLPVPATSFIGRERELATVTELLDTTRVLTLAGTGGCGKTRLALAAASNLVSMYRDGVWLVELAGLADPALVPAAVISALGVREESGRSLTDALVDALRTGHRLLLLDNCEHLIDAVADLAAVLLAACPSLQILATSREALRMPGELTWRVPSLALPDPRQQAAIEALRSVEAVRLFLDRVRLRQPDFILTDRNAPAVMEICRQLDGLPLAIELAAARAPVLTVEQLAARLGDALHVLTIGSRTAMPRQQTLRATLDWSYDLLDPREQTVLARLAVFAGGWTLEAAEAVTVGDGVEADDVLDQLSRLVDKSLVQVDGGGREARYRLLEPIRQYARERLRASGEENRLRDRHVADCLALAQTAEGELKGSRQLTWLKRLEQEHDNLRAALAWCLERGDVERVIQFGWALQLFWNSHGHFSEGRRWMETALLDSDRLAASSQVRALAVAASLAAGQGDDQAAQLLGARSLALAQTAGDRPVTAIMLLLEGHLALLRRDFRRATELSEVSLRLYRELRDMWGVTVALDELGQIRHHQTDYAGAARMFEEALALARTEGNTIYVAESLSNRGLVALRQGDYRRAIQLQEEALALCRELEYKPWIGDVLHRIGWAAILQGDADRAVAAIEESLSVSRDWLHNRYVADALHALAMAELLKQDLSRATTLLWESLILARELGDVEKVTYGVEGLAAVAGSRGKAAIAASLWAAAETLREAAATPVSPSIRAAYTSYISAARAQLGEAGWAEAWARGQAMTLDQAIEFALATVGPVRPRAPEESAVSPQPTILTRRERDVAALVARGLTNHQIAGELGMSQRTVDTHVSHILHKLGLASRAQIHASAKAQVP